MSISLVENEHMTDDAIKKAAGDCLKSQVLAIVPINQGRNSKVYRLDCRDQQYIVKFYVNDSRSRLATEFKSLGFLRSNGLNQVPAPIGINQELHGAFYEYVEGKTILDADHHEIDQAIAFLKSLKGLATAPQAASFSPAAEAFFSLEEIIGNVIMRLKRFDVADQIMDHSILQAYLREEFIPLLDEVMTWSRRYLQEHHVSITDRLDQAHRTLSPSDFGFHNALRTMDGTVVFLDFEYFGWDDPAKMASDFLWHPHEAMHLSSTLKEQFYQGMENIFGEDENFNIRFKAFFPLFGLKWCLILLNEFVSQDAKRRDFAQTIIQDKSTIRQKQLAKAQALSQQIKTTFKDFPYGN